jgi:O-antigen ligase
VSAGTAAWLARAAPALAWVTYLPVGLNYAAWLATVVACALLLRRQRRGAEVWRQPTALATVLLLAWLAASALWSPAPPSHIASHLGLYAQLLGLPLMSTALPPALARATLRQFCLASSLVALLFVLASAGRLPPSLLWHTTVDAEGNQRIANSLLLALGAALTLWHAQQAGRPASRLGWLALTALIVLGLSLQDRRSGLVALPLALLAWALAAQKDWWRRGAVVLGLAACTLLAWQASDNVRARFAEGLAELRQYEPVDTLNTSWGQRLRMVEITASMIGERPLAGHGLASWEWHWEQRTTQGTQLHSHRTPHNEYLLLAHQAGLPAVLLLLWLVVAACCQARRAGSLGMPSLMLWTAWAGAASFNTLLRDGKFALPLLLLAAWCAAAQRPAAVPS